MRRIASSFLIALLPLVSFRLVGEESLKELATKYQFEKVKFDQPQLEIVFSDVEFSLDEWAFELLLDSPSYLPLSIGEISISLLDEEPNSKKTSPFQVKKTINFNREIAKNEQDKLTLTYREKSEDPLLTNPNIEKSDQKKYDFLSENFNVEMEKGKPKETAPFAFEEAKEKSDLIYRHFAHNKVESCPSQPSEKIKTAQPSQATLIASKSLQNEEFSPKKELLSKYRFKEDQAFSWYDEKVIESSQFSLGDYSKFDEKLLYTSFSRGKETLAQRGHFADKYFRELKSENISHPLQESILVTYFPVKEKGEKLSKPGQKEIFLEFITYGLPDVFFDDLYVSLDFPYSSFHSEKKGDVKPHVQEAFFGELPYFYVKKDAQETKKESYSPTKEKVTPLPPKYSLAKGPTLAFELNDQVVAFAITPEFDLYANKNQLELPKKVQEFQSSALAFFQPYLDVKSELREKDVQVDPLPESHQALALVEREQALDLREVFESSAPFTLHNGEDSFSIISHSMEFPQHKVQKQPTEFPVEDSAYLSTLMENRDHDVLMSPSIEEVPSIFFEKRFKFDFIDQERDSKFTLPEDAKLEVANQNRFEMSKLELEHSLSDLPIDTKDYRATETFTSTPQSQKGYAPSLQKSKIPLGESSVVLSIPNEKGLVVPFQFTSREKEIALLDNEESLSKFEPRNQVVFGSIEIDVPNVKQKDIVPKADRKNAEKITEDIPGIEQMQGLVARGGRKLNLHELPFSSPPSKEIDEELALQHSLHRPTLPAFFPSQGFDPFNFETSYSAIKEEQLKHTKEKIAPSGSNVEELELPFVANKKIIPHKAPFVPENALEDLPEVEKMVELANRSENFPNTRMLLEKNPLPARIKNVIEINTDEVADVETGMIQSQAKEMIEDYGQENRYSHGLIALEEPSLEISPKEAEAKSLNQSSRFTNGFLAEIPPPSHLETVTYANEFESEIHYTRREDGKGYYFAIKLKPGEKLNFASPSQNFIFVVDGSSSIKKHRFGVFKEGVARALSYLSEGDSFNIVVADAKLRSFSHSTSAWNKSSLEKAKRFIMDQEYRGYFINYDAFDLISKVTQYFTPDKENIVVLITDGHSFSTLKDHKDDFKELSQANKGKFSIFTATASQGNNLSMLDLLSTFNHGELMYSKTNASFSRQLAVLVKHIESFVAKNVHINVTGANIETGIEFYPNEKTFPSLYADRPYMIYGSIDELKDFDIILQGRAGDQWINVKQSISFKHAIAASHSIKKGMALQKAYVCYDYFMKNEDVFFLSEAQKILEPFNIPTAMR